MAEITMYDKDGLASSQQQQVIANLKQQAQEKIAFWQQIAADLTEAEGMGPEHQVNFLASELKPHTDGWGELQSPGVIDNPVPLLEDILNEAKL